MARQEIFKLTIDRQADERNSHYYNFDAMFSGFYLYTMDKKIVVNRAKVICTYLPIGPKCRTIGRTIFQNKSTGSTKNWNLVMPLSLVYIENDVLAVHRAAARLVLSLPMWVTVSDAMYDKLHWLPAQKASSLNSVASSTNVHTTAHPVSVSIIVILAYKK